MIAVVVLVGWALVTALLFPVTGADEHEGPGDQVWRTSSSAFGVPLSPEWDVLAWLAALALVPVVVVGLHVPAQPPTTAHRARQSVAGWPCPLRCARSTSRTLVHDCKP